MVSVTYADVHNVLNLSTTELSAANTENLIDFAVDVLNLLGNVALDNMSGTAGSKTLTLTQIQRAGMLIAVRAVYYGFWKDIETASVGGMSISPENVFDNPEVMRTLRFAARQLQSRSFERT